MEAITAAGFRLQVAGFNGEMEERRQNIRRKVQVTGFESGETRFSVTLNSLNVSRET
jgi:hypothetical protein